MAKRTTDAMGVINEIQEVLMEADNSFIEKIANQVLGRKVKWIDDDDVYPEDQLFEIEE